MPFQNHSAMYPIYNLELGRDYIAGPPPPPPPSIARETSYRDPVNSWYVTRVVVRKGKVVLNEV